jgi:sterol desaturase/sphingolipid hydroxylase (fatty acid hydroxylase superfamily)
MQEHVLAAISSISWLAIFALFFWLISMLLPKPEHGKHENLRNFHCAHEPSLFNKEAKIEWFYPLVTALLTQPLIFLVVYEFYQFMADKVPYQMFDKSIESLPMLVQVFLGLLVIDISLWIRHSFVHKYCWSFHAVHHCAKEITWLTTKRLHPVDHFVMSVIDFAVLYFIGFSAEGMAAALIIKNLHNMWVHSNIVLDYPKPWKYIFVSPNMHRWHHATEKEAHDKNFCVVFAFVDYFMGTYYVPDNALPKEYGSGFEELDDVERKNIVTELVLPFKLAVPGATGDVSANPKITDTASELS